MDQLEALILRFKNRPLIKGVLERLAKELPGYLCYHGPEHTEDVLRETLFFASEDNLSEHELYLLAIGAAFHDLGFIISREDHEKRSAELAKKAMANQGEFKAEDISLVEMIIEDTVLTKYGIAAEYCPTSKLSRYLLDADTSNLGRPDFFKKAELVRKEYGIQDKKAFYENLLGLIKSHRWHTDAALKHRQAQKEENISKLETMLATL